MLWSADDLLAATGGTMRQEFAAAGISIDTRSLRPGDLFVALTDARDGHDFVAQALDKGAAGALVRTGQLTIDGPLLDVADPLQGLRDLARFARARFAGRLVAVTGSVGKTTSKEMLRALLATAGRVHAADASFNNHIGVPLTLARMPADADFAVVEIGMNHPGEIAPLAQMARPDVALVTNVAASHIGHMGSLAAIAHEKGTIFSGLKPDGVAVYATNAEHAGLLALAAGHARQRRVGPGGEAEILAQTSAADGSDIVARIGAQTVSFHLGAAGRHMAQNAVMALTAVDALGVDVAEAAGVLARFGAVAGRGAQQPIRGGKARLIDESYNASPLSMRAALALLKLSGASRKIAVLGDMRELGDFGPALHAELAPDVIENADVLLSCGPLMGHLHRAVLDAPMLDAAAPQKPVCFHADHAAALAPVAAGWVQAGDVVLVKGSLGSKMKIVVEALLALPETD